jgi:hypothetical protein
MRTVTNEVLCVSLRQGLNSIDINMQVLRYVLLLTVISGCEFRGLDHSTLPATCTDLHGITAYCGYTASTLILLELTCAGYSRQSLASGRPIKESCLKQKTAMVSLRISQRCQWNALSCRLVSGY